MRVGSLFSGGGGLDLAVEEAFGARPVWFAENDPAAGRVLAAHWPEVPNHGDVTGVDWATIQPADVITAGFPCTDISSAGQRVGLRPGTRSGLWSHATYAISQLRPELVVIENVRGLLSADAACELEPCPWCMGDHESRPLRALGCVLGDLADLGYDARWCGLRASDVGAPHERFRVFITAWPATDADRVGPVRSGTTRGRRTGPEDHGDGVATHSAGPGRRWDQQVDVGRDSSQEIHAGETEPGRHDSPSPDTPSDGRHEGRPEPTGEFRGPDAAQRSDGLATGRSWVSVDGTDYGPAIHRWETILGRAAPVPTQPGKRGGQQLNPVFTEWLMGWPEGWVTGVPGLPRADQVRVCGNGVVPQQALAAFNMLGLLG
jgi:DNA (cytosine-5)-methyltransferase 1